MKAKVILGIFLGMLFLAVPSFAFGVTAPYWEGNPLSLQPGESKEVRLELQNMVGGKDITLRASLKEGQEIAQFIDASQVYAIPYLKEGVPVHLKIVIPPRTKIGTLHKVTLAFSTTELQQDNQGLQIIAEIEKSFDVIVQGQEESLIKRIQPQRSYLPIILVIIVAWLMWWKKHRKLINNRK